MCFSANASFIASGVIGAIGVATLRQVREPRALLFASVPLLFAFHQFVEGFVWLGFDGVIGPAALDHVSFIFMIYAYAIVPLLLPVAVLLMEPTGWRRRVILGLTGIGALVFGLDIFGLVGYPSQVFVEHHSIAYRNPVTRDLVITGLYILATCGALLMSSHRVVRWFGVLNIIGLTIAQLIKEYAFASVWCFYAAIFSVIIFWQFYHRTISIANPNEQSAMFRPLLLPWLRWAKAKSQTD